MSRDRLWAAALITALLSPLAGQAAETVGAAKQPETLTEAAAASGVQIDKNKPMLLQADELVYEDGTSRVIAKGNVEIYYNSYALLADQVIYDQAANTLTASGNVRIKEPDGAVINADQITLSDDFRDGFIGSLKVVTKDDARIAAEKATRTDAETTVFDNAVFTPCKPCQDRPDSPPIWRLRAGKITHRKSEGNLYYENVFLDIFGVPVAYAPYFFSPDPSVKRRTGFLAPTFGSSKNLGFWTEIPYFWAISPSMDVTLSPRITSNEGVLMQGSFRQRLRNGAYRVDLAGVLQDDPAVGAATDSDFRGSLVTEGDFSLGSWWNLGWDVTLETDDTFRRLYDLDNRIKTDRVSEVHVIGQSDRNYFSTYAYEFGGLLRDDSDIASSRAHPSLDYHYIAGSPVLGGELSFDANALSLSREDGTDSNRVIAQANWRRQLIDPLGEVFTPFGYVRGDSYKVADAVDPLTGAPLPGDDRITRGVAAAGLQYNYPFVARTAFGSHVVEPVAQIIARPDSVEQASVPNEDAQSLVFDDTLLFDWDKFSGYDRIETGVRTNYGLQYTLQLNNGGSVRAVAGQSRHLAGVNPFALGTGLETEASDYVAGLYFSPISTVALVAQSRFEESTLDLKRQDVSARAALGPAAVALSYAYDRTFDQIGEERRAQEVTASGSLQVTDVWSLFGGLRYDIEDELLISDSLGVRYQDECFALSITYKESNITDRDVDPDQSVMVHFELKSLGGTTFETDNIGPLAADENRKD